MVTADYIFTQVQALVDDLEESFATDDYIQPFLQMAQDDFVNEVLKDSNIGAVKAAIVVPAVPAGTTSLKQELMPSGRLELLEQLIELREKRAGAADTDYVYMVPRYTPVSATSQSSLNLTYTYTGTDIILPGATQDVDLWAWGEFAPAKITGPDTPIVPGIETVLKYATASLVAGSRSNANMMKMYAGRQLVQQSAWKRNIYKIQQSIRTVNKRWRPRSSYLSSLPPSE